MERSGDRWSGEQWSGDESGIYPSGEEDPAGFIALRQSQSQLVVGHDSDGGRIG